MVVKMIWNITVTENHSVDIRDLLENCLRKINLPFANMLI